MTKLNTKTDALLDDLLQDCETPEDILGEHGLIKGLPKRLVERALQAELTNHLGYPPHARHQAKNVNVRNGTSAKTVETDQRPVELAVPRDRAGAFEPKVVPKRQRRLEGFDDKVLALYAHGLHHPRYLSQYLYLGQVMICDTFSMPNVVQSCMKPLVETHRIRGHAIICYLSFIRRGLWAVDRRIGYSQKFLSLTGKMIDAPRLVFGGIQAQTR